MNAIDHVEQVADAISIIFNKLPVLIQGMREVAMENDRMRVDLTAAADSAMRANDANNQLQSEIADLRERIHDEIKKNARLEHLIKSAGEAFGQALRDSPDLQRAIQDARPIKEVDGRSIGGA